MVGTKITSKNQTSIPQDIRNKLGVGMSQYLHDRIIQTSNIEVMEGTEVVEVIGNGKLEFLRLQSQGKFIDNFPANYMFIFIGASPKTFWLHGSVAMDEKKFILTGPKLVDAKLWKDEKRQPLNFETSMPGVFACGDVRFGSVKRFGSAVGEGMAALSMCHTYRNLTGMNNH